MRDHGGNIDLAIRHYGPGDWIDLSTGINRRPYPMPPLTDADWRSLPPLASRDRLVAAASRAWSVNPGLRGLALGGAQAAIQLVPRLLPRGCARILTPTYNEHAACLRAEGWQVHDCSAPEELAGANVAVIVNPNNPDGRSWTPEQLIGLSRQVDLLVVDESFADPLPGLSLLPVCGAANILILRSFGKFYGLAGLRLGFAFGPDDLIARLAAMAGPWPVSGPAITAGIAALSDDDWADAMRAQLAADCRRADAMAAAAGWPCLGGTPLFRLYDTPDAAAAQAALARHHIWTRTFPYSGTWLRLGLPGPDAEWARLETALAHGPAKQSVS